MAKRISAAQKALAKNLRAAGNSWPVVAKKTGISPRSLQYIAKADSWPDKGFRANNTAKPTQLAPVDFGELADIVKSRLASDIETSVEALASWRPAELELAQLEKRERVADSVQKRAANLFNIGQSDQPVVNIAVLSQLPDAINH